MPLPDQPPFAHFLGITLISVAPERLEAELAVRDEFTNYNGVMHGGALMAYADSLGGTVSRASLKPGQRTTTIESKTNFFAGIPIGNVARAESIPLHRGRTTIVVQTKITRNDGRLAAIVTQTQMVLAAKGQD
ncbi:MAG TPA: PaaI family thioesterase [Xanthobacteraceae bacterium]|nr:PaaI family thioesterase [Xanthobacteraceae bacterium]